MKDFTIKNILKHWLKIWPITLILLIIGCGIGVYSICSTEISYKTSSKVLFKNSALSYSSTEYSGILNSSIVKKQRDDNCSLSSSQSGSILSYDIKCLTDNSNAVSENVLNILVTEVKKIYGEKNVEAIVLQSSNSSTKNDTSSNIKKFLIPFIAMFVLSFVVSFIKYDCENAKNNA